MNKYIYKYKSLNDMLLDICSPMNRRSIGIFFNCLKSKQKADAPSVDTFYDFFKDVYSTEDDPNEVEIPLNYKF